MAFFSKKYNERAIRMERYVMKNKLFFITAFVVIIALTVTELKKNNVENINTSVSDTVVQQEIDEEKVATCGNSSESEIPHWRFYYSDLFVFVIGGTICTVNIVRERRKAKEKLQ